MKCSFFGHRKIEICNILINKLKKTIEELIVKGADTFYFGGFGEFDDLCYQIVSKLKIKYPNIKRIYCLEDERYLRFGKRPNWLKKSEYENYIYLTLKFNWWYQRIYYRNCEMADLSDVLIFYVNEKNVTSGAYKIFKYAKNIKKKVINTFY